MKSVPPDGSDQILLNRIAELEANLQSLKVINSEYREIVVQATELIFKVDITGHFLFVSGEFERLLGITNDIIVGAHFSTIIYPDDLSLCAETFGILLKMGKAPANIVFRVMDISGNYKWVDCSAVCLYDESGNGLHIIGFAHDITRQQLILENLRTSEMALRISEEQYRSLFDALAEGAVLINKEGFIVACNRSAEKIFNVSKEDIMRYNSFSNQHGYFHEDQSPFPITSHPSYITMNTGESFKNVVLGLYKRDGSFCWISLNTVPLYYTDQREKPDAVVASFTDITQLKKDKAELLRNQELLAIENERYLEATKAVAQAVVDAQEKERADIGYELHDNVNQILSTARLYLELARNDDMERINLIGRSAEGIATAIKEIRNISRSLVPSSLNDLGLIASIDDLVSDIRFTKAIEVEFYNEGNIEGIIGEKIKLMLFRIIQEQVTNVLKHAEATNLVIEMVAEPNCIHLSIADNGKGFDMLAAKNNKGVGLSNIANRAELFNGKINMVTSPGNGCKLRILIPL
ncbi:MAG: PAS domain S-box protein [Flavitalea sp.]